MARLRRLWSLCRPRRSCNRRWLPHLLEESLLNNSATLRLTFPNRDHPPTCSTQRRDVPRISRYVPVELGYPEPDTRFGHRAVRTARVAVPETPVYEDHRAVTFQDQVRPAWEILCMQPEPEAQAMRDLPHRQFRLRIARANPRHNLAATLGIDDVHMIGEAPSSGSVILCLRVGGSRRPLGKLTS